MRLIRNKLILINGICLTFLLFSGYLSANPCALPHLQSFGEGIGGTGKKPIRQEGIGGTGHSGPHEGIGGTGYSEGLGGTGAPVITQKMTVVGVITGFASVCVNGLEIHFDDATKVLVDEKESDLESLRVGQIARVEVDAIQGRLTANAMEIQHEVIGPVEAIDQNTGVVHMVGQTIPKGS